MHRAAGGRRKTRPRWCPAWDYMATGESRACRGQEIPNGRPVASVEAKKASVDTRNVLIQAQARACGAGQPRDGFTAEEVAASLRDKRV
jgi:hypothetical protein